LATLRAQNGRRMTSKATEPVTGEPTPEAQGPISWKALAVFCGIGTGGLAYYSIEKQRRMEGTLLSRHNAMVNS